ncbi:MAG: hypothetical protein HYY16_02215 [Planctomycetes bacterium]|nr:hypothetical protein [Planctomycetota bacterium]
MNRLVYALLRAFGSARAEPQSLEARDAARRERLRALTEERSRLAEMIPYLIDFHFDDIAREYRRRMAKIDAEARAIKDESDEAA